MRKDNKDGKGLRIYTGYVVKGYNADRLLNALKKAGIGLYDVKKAKPNEMSLYIKYKDNKKFFAITKELCYNKQDIKRIKNTGADYGLLFLKKNLGVLIGVVIFLIVAVMSNDVIFSFSFSGNGKVYKREVEEYLAENGTRVFSRFSKVDLDALADGILANNDHLTFVSCKKQGNRLGVELILKEDSPETLSGKAERLVSDVDGVIEKLKVYRGTAVVSEGDAVLSGDVIVEGFATVKEQTINVNVIASVSIISESEFTFFSEKDNDEKSALLFAEENLCDREILSSFVSKRQDGDNFVYTVKLSVRRIIDVG